MNRCGRSDQGTQFTLTTDSAQQNLASMFQVHVVRSKIMHYKSSSQQIPLLIFFPGKYHPVLQLPFTPILGVI